MTLVMTPKHLLALSLATPCLPVDSLIVGNLEYALCANFTVVLGQLSTIVTYETAFNHRLRNLAHLSRRCVDHEPP